MIKFQIYYKNISWDSIGDDQYCKSDSTVSLLVALSIDMKNRHPSILYSSRGFLCPKLLTFTWPLFHVSMYLLKSQNNTKVTSDNRCTAELSLFMFTRWSLQKQSRVFTRTAFCIKKNTLGAKETHLRGKKDYMNQGNN